MFRLSIALRVEKSHNNRLHTDGRLCLDFESLNFIEAARG
jgi:hypothetical protein